MDLWGIEHLYQEFMSLDKHLVVQGREWAVFQFAKNRALALVMGALLAN
jgi:hypothetical protein